MQNQVNNLVEGETGFVTEAKGYLLTIEGLPTVSINDIIINDRQQRAIVTALESESVEALLLDRGGPESGDRFMANTHGIKFSFGDHLFGRVINALGDSLDGKGEIPEGTEDLDLDVSASGMDTRATMTEQLYTGMSAVDVLLPIAKGQRQLIVGPTSSGKAKFIENTVYNQKNEPVVCIYAFIGRPLTYIEDITSRILSEEGNKKTIVVASFSDEPAPIIYITPTVSFALAEHFSCQGKDVLLILDDLGTHAKYLREISLLSGRIPGRESYPGDTFYQHAHLLERAGYFNKTVGGGSITVLPMLETGIEDITSLVATNLMAATDGHLFFSPALHAEGYFPSILSSQSVTRVGRRTQNNLSKQLSIRVQALLAEYEKQRDYSRFGTHLSEKTRNTIKQGELLRTFLRQESMSNVPHEAQLILLSLVFTSLFNEKDVQFAEKNRNALEKALHTHKSLEPVVTSAKRGTISLDQFVKRLQEVVPYFESVCQQL